MANTAFEMSKRSLRHDEVIEALTSTKTVHSLIAGTTGSGKSVLLNAVILGLIQMDVECYFFDLKRVELGEYKKTKVCKKYITEPEDVPKALDSVISEMEHRYSRMKGKESSAKHIYVIIDELADTLTQRGVLDRLVKIGRLGRAANIHLLCATQDPSRNTLPAKLAQNFTCTVALRCRSSIESRQIIGVSGAESLPIYGYGYMWDARGISTIEVTPVSDEVKENILSASVRGFINSHSLFKSILNSI